MAHTVSTTDGLVALSKYRFRIRAINAYGASDWSSELVATVAPLPGVFAAVIKDQDFSTSTSIKVKWVVPGTETEPIMGFKLKMKEEMTDKETIVYDQPANPNVKEYVAAGLKPGASYTFSVVGYNYNGAGLTWSPAASFKSCTIPKGVPIPLVTEQSLTQLAFAWSEPADQGGCQVTAYELFLDDGAAGAFSSKHLGPSHIKTAVVPLNAALLGSGFRYRLEAVNAIGRGASLAGFALFAAVPSSPAAGPVSDPAITGKDRIKVTWSSTTGAATGGSEVLSY